MTQEIIVYIIGGALALLAIIRIVKFLTGKHDPCEQCGECDHKKAKDNTSCDS